MDYRALVQKLGDRTNQNSQTSELILEHRTGHPIRELRQQDTSKSFETIRQFCYIIGYYLYQEIEAVENYRKNVRERESRLNMLYEMKEKYKKIYGMQAVVVLNLMHKGKDLLAFMK